MSCFQKGTENISSGLFAILVGQIAWGRTRTIGQKSKRLLCVCVCVCEASYWTELMCWVSRRRDVRQRRTWLVRLNRSVVCALTIIQWATVRNSFCLEHSLLRSFVSSYRHLYSSIQLLILRFLQLAPHLETEWSKRQHEHIKRIWEHNFRLPELSEWRSIIIGGFMFHR